MFLCQSWRTLPLIIASLLPWQTSATTLVQAIQQAGVYNASFQADMFQRFAANEKEAQGLAGLLPSIQLNINYNQQDQPGATYAAKVTRHDSAFTFNQPLFDVGKFADYLRGRALSKRGDVAFLGQQQKLIYDVAEAYAKVLYQREILKAANAATDVYARTLAQTKMAMSLGDATRVDLDEAQANLEVYLAKEIEASNNLNLAGTRYNRLTGLDYQTIVSFPAACLMKRKHPETETVLFQKVLANNTDIRRAEAELDIAKTEVYKASGAHLPTVNFQAYYGNNWSRAENSNGLDDIFGSTSKTKNTNVGISVSVPLFSGGGQLSQSREAAYAREQARYSVIDTKQVAKEQLHNALLNIRNGERLVTSTQRVILSEESKVKSTRVGKEQGLRTQLDELNALQRYYDAMNKNAEAIYSLFVAEISLDKAIGDLGYKRMAEMTCTH